MTDTARPAGPFGDRVAAGDWSALTDELGEYGSALTGQLLTPAECAEIAGLYDEDDRFRTTVDMARHRFGSGQYRYFTHDLPDPVRELREAFYPHLLPVARDWAEKLGRPAPWPDTLREWLTMCHTAGQDRSAQILLRYGPGDWNALHRDVFGDMVFPLQVVIGLSAPGTDFTGGEFIMTEQRPVLSRGARPRPCRRGTGSSSPPATDRSRPSAAGPTDPCGTV